MAISLDEFYNNNKGKKLANPNPEGSRLGECVSLVQQYLFQCLEIPFKPRGNAKEWVSTCSDIATKVDSGEPEKGDIVVYPTRGGGYGHIGVAISKTTIFEQNVSPNYVAETRLFSNISGERVILRPNKSLVEDIPPSFTGVYLNATKYPFRIRQSPVTGSPLVVVPLGGRAEVAKFLGIQSDGYQWVQVSYVTNKGCALGYSQLDTKNCYTLTGTCNKALYLCATKMGFRIRRSPVNGAQDGFVSTGKKARIVSFLGIQSDGYQWAKVDFWGTIGYSQVDTKNCYTINV